MGHLAGRLHDERGGVVGHLGERLHADAALDLPRDVGTLRAALGPRQDAARVVARARRVVRRADRARELCRVVGRVHGEVLVAEHHVVDQACVLVGQEVAVEDKLALERHHGAAVHRGSAGVVAHLDLQAAAGRDPGGVAPLALPVAEQRHRVHVLEHELDLLDARDDARIRGLVDVQDLEGVHVHVEGVVDGVAAADVPDGAVASLKDHVDLLVLVLLEDLEPADALVLRLLPVGDAPLHIGDHRAVQLLREAHVPVPRHLPVHLGLARRLQIEVGEVLLLAGAPSVASAPERGVLSHVDGAQLLRALPREGDLVRRVGACVGELDEDVLPVASSQQEVRVGDLEEAHLVYRDRQRHAGVVVVRLRPRDAVARDRVERDDHLCVVRVELEAAHPLRGQAHNAHQGHVTGHSRVRRLVRVVHQEGVDRRARHLVGQEVVQLDLAPVRGVSLQGLLPEGVVCGQLVVDALEPPLRVPNHKGNDVRIGEGQPLLFGQLHEVAELRGVAAEDDSWTARPGLARWLRLCLKPPPLRLQQRRCFRDSDDICHDDAKHAAPSRHRGGPVAMRVPDEHAPALRGGHMELVAVALLLVLRVRLDGDVIGGGVGGAHGIEQVRGDLHAVQVDVEDIPALVRRPTGYVLLFEAEVARAELGREQRRQRDRRGADAHDVPGEDIVLAQEQVLHLEPVAHLCGHHVLDVNLASVEVVLHEDVQLLAGLHHQAGSEKRAPTIGSVRAEPLVELGALVLHRLKGPREELHVGLGDGLGSPVRVEPGQDLEDGDDGRDSVRAGRRPVPSGRLDQPGARDLEDLLGGLQAVVHGVRAVAGPWQLAPPGRALHVPGARNRGVGEVLQLRRVGVVGDVVVRLMPRRLGRLLRRMGHARQPRPRVGSPRLRLREHQRGGQRQGQRNLHGFLRRRPRNVCSVFQVTAEEA
mmetsp:Transcript_13281/g.35101  ORF Transcript_13281/g.35101 Transcript_13281/m.35101 type:complete len:930 (+) Transcript_13281:523-3312(+)